MRMIADKGEGGLILAIFVRTYYVDDPQKKSYIFQILWLLMHKCIFSLLTNLLFLETFFNVLRILYIEY